MPSLKASSATTATASPVPTRSPIELPPCELRVGSPDSAPVDRRDGVPGVLHRSGRCLGGPRRDPMRSSPVAEVGEAQPRQPPRGSGDIDAVGVGRDRSAPPASVGSAADSPPSRSAVRSAAARPATPPRLTSDPGNFGHRRPGRLGGQRRVGRARPSSSGRLARIRAGSSPLRRARPARVEPVGRARSVWYSSSSARSSPVTCSRRRRRGGPGRRRRRGRGLAGLEEGLVAF